MVYRVRLNWQIQKGYFWISLETIPMVIRSLLNGRNAILLHTIPIIIPKFQRKIIVNFSKLKSLFHFIKLETSNFANLFLKIVILL